MSYTDKDRHDIAWKQYSDYDVGQPVKISKQRTIGIVRRVITDDTGLKVYVIEDPKTGHVTVLYRGSEGPGKPGSKVDWFDNDFPMAKNIVTGKQKVTPQLKSAARVLNQVLKDFPGQVTVYGHSLGSMDAQYALANVSDPRRITGAYLYQGPNIYPVLKPDERKRVDGMKYRIHNYVDPVDVVPIGYKRTRPGQRPDLTSDGAVGIVHQIDSKYAGPIDQHMWGGYVFDSNGNLRLVKDDETRFTQRYGKSLDTAYMAGSVLSAYKTQFKKGGVSGNEKIFLDATQAMLMAQSLGQATKAGHDAIEKIAKDAQIEAEKLYNSILVHRPWGFISDQFEIISAYQEAGVTHDRIVGYTDSIFNQKVSESQTICENFEQMEQKILQGIQTVLDRDSELAKDFEVWNG